jgi:hypothetical protein
MGVRPTSVGRAKIEASHGLGTVAQVQWHLVHGSSAIGSSSLGL